MLVAVFRHHPAAGRAGQEADLDQVRLIDVLNSFDLFRGGGGDGGRFATGRRRAHVGGFCPL